MDDTKPLIVESFGMQPEPYTCTECGSERRFYDLLSTGDMICLFCSVTEGYEKDANCETVPRDPHLMTTDEELIEIKNALVEWDLAKGKIKLDELYVPEDVAQKLYDIVVREDTTLDVVVTSALRMLIAANEGETFSQETTPTLLGAA